MNDPIYILHVDPWMVAVLVAGALIVIFTAMLAVIDWLLERFERTEVEPTSPLFDQENV